LPENLFQKSNDGIVIGLYFLHHIPSFDIRFDSLDFFGSIFHQAFPEK
jgi:5'-3' exonuclease